MNLVRRPCVLAVMLALATTLLPGCETTGETRPADNNAPVSEPIPLPSAPPVEVSDLPPEMSSPMTPPSNAPLPAEGDVLTSGEVLDRLRARLSTPTCIVGPNNTRWRHKYAGYPQHFADEVQETLPMMLVVLDQLEQRKLPGEFALIPIVESWYRPDTRSFGGADGMWQMLDETSRNNGATVISGYDGRLSALDSTDAALTYLGKLHAMFNDWRLTAMAYNSGEYRLMRTMTPEELAERSAGGVHYRRPNGLSFTTYEYVSKMRALTCLLAQPERQGIPLLNTVPITHWVPYNLPADVDSLDELARRLGTDAEELKTFNRGFRNGQIVADAPRTILVPASTRPRWASAGTPASAQPTEVTTSTSAPANPYVVAPYHSVFGVPASTAPAAGATSAAPPVAVAPLSRTPVTDATVHSTAMPVSAVSVLPQTAAKSGGTPVSAAGRESSTTAPLATFKPPAVTTTSTSVQASGAATPSTQLTTPQSTGPATTLKTAPASAASMVPKAAVPATPSTTPAATPTKTSAETSVSSQMTGAAAVSEKPPQPATGVEPPATKSEIAVAPVTATPAKATDAPVETKPATAPQAPAPASSSVVPKATVVATTPTASAATPIKAAAEAPTSPPPTTTAAAPLILQSTSGATPSSQSSAPATAAPSLASPTPATPMRPTTMSEPTPAPKSETAIVPVAATPAKTIEGPVAAKPSTATQAPAASASSEAVHSPPATLPTAVALAPVQAPAQQPAQQFGYHYGSHAHLVGPDETLAAIAQRYGLSVDQLQEWNHLDPDEPVKPGQLLKLEP